MKYIWIFIGTRNKQGQELITAHVHPMHEIHQSHMLNTNMLTFLSVVIGLPVLFTKFRLTNPTIVQRIANMV